jgi:hypothetical protein
MASAAESCANNGQNESRRGFLNMGLKPVHSYVIPQLSRNYVKLRSVLTTLRFFIYYPTVHNIIYFPGSCTNSLIKTR